MVAIPGWEQIHRGYLAWIAAPATGDAIRALYFRLLAHRGISKHPRTVPWQARARGEHDRGTAPRAALLPSAVTPASAAASYITGQVIFVDGGFSST